MLALGAGMVAGLRLRARLAVALVLVLVYVPLAGGGPSIQRAGVMGAAGLVAALAGRPASRWYALGLAVVVTLALNPRASGEVGWQLSFAAVVGLLALAPRWREGLRRARLPGPIADAAAVTAAATVATAPLMALYFQQVSLASLPANLAAAPAVAPVMWLGMLAIAAAQVSPALCVPLNALNGPLLAYVEWVAHVAAAPPAAALPVRIGGPVGLAATYAAAGAAMLARRAGCGRWLGRPRAAGSGGPARSVRRRLAAVGVALVVGGLARRARPARRRRAAAGRARGLVPRRRPGRRDAAAARRRLDPRRHRPARRADPQAAAGVRRRAAGHAADHPRRGGPRGDGARDHPRVPASARAQRRRRAGPPRSSGACRGPPSRRTPASASASAASGSSSCGRRGPRPAGEATATRTCARSSRSPGPATSTSSCPPTRSPRSPPRSRSPTSTSSRSPTTGATTKACPPCSPARSRSSPRSRSGARTPTGIRHPRPSLR